MLMKRISFALFTAALAIAACSVETTDADADDDGASGTIGTNNNCPGDCMAKLSGCGAPDDEVAGACDAFCGKADGDAIACLQNASCDALQNAGDPNELCPGSGNTGGSGAGGNGAGGSAMCIDLNELGCDPDNGDRCCGLLACEAATGECCVATFHECAASSDCCSELQCLVDLGDPAGEKMICRNP